MKLQNVIKSQINCCDKHCPADTRAKAAQVLVKTRPSFLVARRENCNKKAAKVLRQLYRRPYFIPHMVDLSDSNWVLISSDFKGKVYKEVRSLRDV